MRYASAKGIAPEEVTDGVIEAYLRYRAETTALGAGVADCRSIARSWNRCVDEIAAWPKVRLLEQPLPIDPNALLWEEVPQSLRREIDAYLATLLKTRRGASGKRWNGAKISTVRTREAEIKAFVRQAVRIGVRVDELTSLRKLLDPDLVERVLVAYREKVSLVVEYSLIVGTENSLAGALARGSGARPRNPGLSHFADHARRRDSDGGGDSGPAGRTHDDFGPSPPGPVCHGDCATYGA